MKGAAENLQREPGKGFEPPTGRLQGGCSTSELPGRAACGAPHAGFASLSARSSLRLSAFQHALFEGLSACQQALDDQRDLPVAFDAEIGKLPVRIFFGQGLRAKAGRQRIR